MLAKQSTHAFTDILRNRLSLVDVVGRYVPLTKRGSNYWGCCPFHSEKTASFCVNPERNCFHCFGCGEHGDLFSFVMKYLHIDFKQAIKELADLAGLEVPEESKKTDIQKQREEKYFGIMEMATKIYQRKLNTKVGADAKAYLLSRGFTEEMIEKYRIGFAPDSNTISEQFISEPSDVLLTTGLVKMGDSGCYDVFKSRIMFPIIDLKGRTVAFSGRVIETEGPKYVNSADTVFFHKRQTLFGLYYAKNSIFKQNRAIVVEGQIDCIKMHEAGFTETVAPLGSALTPEHIDNLCSINRNILFCFDGDGAGRKAALKACINFLPFMRYESDARVVLLPSGKDPDEILSDDGGVEMKRILKNSIGILEFLWQETVKMYNTREIIGRANLSRKLRQMSSLIDDPELRDDVNNEFKHLTLKRFYSKSERLAMGEKK